MVDTPMPLTAHLAELRTRVLWCLGALVAGFLVCYGFADKIVAALQTPANLLGKSVKVPLQVIAPAEAVITHIKVGMIVGLFLVLPFLLHQLWKFVAPGLLEHEKKYTIPFILGSAALFYTGGVVFYLVLPFILSFLLSFATEDIKAQWSVGYYITFCVRLMIAFGLVFQLPMVVVFCTQLGILTSRLLMQYFRHAVVLMFVLAAMLTPTTDPLSLVFLVLPMLLLYGVSILAARSVEGRQR
ncbi:MAG: twin-arginine translocase subunit TatC [Candidatus Tectomicrobia bacterium]|uniref:Sec-independent protein translocase protein TatC n=1 Tax=Tectimicrobiota bacterium TaxID=2528274 RepID=A0A937W1G9_UNCTE|nr:twin-arginine translocase subunit TatC [Candidatus Tectomicrobia bacterium]